jgi:hypothetical protein
LTLYVLLSHSYFLSPNADCSYRNTGLPYIVGFLVLPFLHLFSGLTLLTPLHSPGLPDCPLPESLRASICPSLLFPGSGSPSTARFPYRQHPRGFHCCLTTGFSTPMVSPQSPSRASDQLLSRSTWVSQMSHKLSHPNQD